jgi:hypothetical protein
MPRALVLLASAAFALDLDARWLAAGVVMACTLAAHSAFWSSPYRVYRIPVPPHYWLVIDANGVVPRKERHPGESC